MVKAHHTRRVMLHRLGACMVATSPLLASCKRVTGSSQDAEGEDLAHMSADNPDAALYYHYRGIPGGGELYIDADYETNGRSPIYDASGVMFADGQFSPKNNHTRGYFGDEANGGLPVPKALRMLRYPQDAQVNREWYGEQRLYVQPKFLGLPAVDVTVPVASRIPDEALERLRKYRGASLKLKLRLTRETLLVGWEVRNGKDYPFKTDKVGNAYTTDEDTLVGGDFAERRMGWELVNSVVRRVLLKGWQIDPRTGQKVEADF